MAISRRTFISSSLLSMASVLPLSLADALLAQAATTVKRRDVNGTDAGAAAAVKSYRRGVQVMKGRPPHDPTSWTFQANIHAYPGSKGVMNDDPEKEFRESFPDTIPGLSAAERARRLQMARTVWNTCPHGPASFLSWHRVYLYFFERTVAAAAGDATFGLPYWNWTKDRSLPKPFWESVDGAQDKNALYWSNRNPGINGGADGSPPTRTLTQSNVRIEMLSDPILDERLQAGDTIGFGRRIEQRPHGPVHTTVGDDTGMGFFEAAARDPIFWLHHANIDRLWESWSKLPGHASPTTPSWRTDKHSFAGPDGQLTSLTTEQVLVAAQILQQGYEYDHEETLILAAGPAPTPSATVTTVAGEAPIPRSAPQPGAPAAATASQPAIAKVEAVVLSGQPKEVTLTPSGPAAAVPAGAASNDRWILVLRDLSVVQSPADSFAVYLNLPDGQATDPGRSEPAQYFVGELDFFYAARKGSSSGGRHAGHGVEAPLWERDVTAILRRQNWGGGPIRVTIVPTAGTVDPKSEPAIGSVELTRRSGG